MKNVGFIGLGRMGFPMAANLVKAGFDVTVFDLAPAPLGALRTRGARVATSISELGATNDVVLTMLPSSREVTAVVAGPDGLAAGMRPGSLLVDMSTSDPMVTRSLGETLALRDIAMVDAPVAKGIPAAEAGTLTIMAGGEAKDVERSRPFLAAIGDEIVHCGPLGSGHIVKIVNNLLVGVLVPVCAEALALGVKAGVSADTLMQVVTKGSGGSFVLDQLVRKHLLHNDYEGVFSVDYMIKDMNLALGLSRDYHVTMPFGALAAQLYEGARNAGWEKECYVIVAKLVETLAGVEVRTSAAADAGASTASIESECGFRPDGAEPIIND